MNRIYPSCDLRPADFVRSTSCHVQASYLHDLAGHFESGALSDEALMSMEDAQLMKALTAVKVSPGTRFVSIWSDRGGDREK
jgi:hypothetical protein